MIIYSKRVIHLSIFAFVAAVVTFFGYISPVSAATLTVTKTIDSTPDGCSVADCSLREAVLEANSNGEADTIALSAGTYTLTLSGDDDVAAVGDLDIRETGTTIEGEDATTTIIDGNNSGGVIALIPGSSLNMSHVTIQNGSANDGAGINAQSADVVLDSVIIKNNTAFNAGGGIVFDGGTLTITKTLFDNNTVTYDRGGGLSIESNGTVIVTNSIFVNNTAAYQGGAIYNGSIFTIQYSTFYNNTANSSPNDLLSDTNVTAKGNIFSGGCGGWGIGTSLGYNIDAGTGCALNDSTDLSSTNPLLVSAGLQDNGGEIETIALQATSPAIDVIPSANCITAADVALTEDARGWLRPDNSACDIGAYEADNTNPSITVTTNTAEVNTVECAVDTFTDPGATATDNENDFFGTSITVQTSGSVTTTTPNTYTLTYSATDSSGNIDTDTRTVTVQDTQAPQITLVGDATIEVAEGDTFTDPGVAVSDVCNISPTVETDNPVDTATPGEYTMTYTANDGYTTSSVTRTVTVVAEAPIEEEEEEEVSVMTDVIQNDDGTVTIFYDDESSQTMTPFGGKNSFIFVLSTDATRLIVSNGKLVRVFVNGAQIVQKRVQQKKPDQYKLRVVKFFSAYHSVIIVTQRNQRLQMTVMRLTAQDALKKKEQKRIRLHEQQIAQDMKLRIKKKKKRIIVIFGEDRFMYKLKKNGQLIRL